LNLTSDEIDNFPICLGNAAIKYSIAITETLLLPMSKKRFLGENFQFQQQVIHISLVSLSTRHNLG
jgi:hypothetical protein